MKENCSIFLKFSENGLLTEVSLCGIDSIKKVNLRNIKQVKYNENGEQIPNTMYLEKCFRNRWN